MGLNGWGCITFPSSFGIGQPGSTRTADLLDNGRSWVHWPSMAMVVRMTWIDHTGSFPPQHASVTERVNVRFRDGEETRRPEEVRYWLHNWAWDRRHPSPSEIVAYQVVR